MVDVAVVALFLALLVSAIALAQSLTWVITAFVVLVSLVGAGIQATLALDLQWSFRDLQVGLIAGMVVIAGAAWWKRRQGGRGQNMRRQLLVVLGPVLVLGTIMIVMRLIASGSPGVLTGVGWLAAHPYAEDNAKWLNLAAQLASGQELQFNGYAGGPLVLVIVLVATCAAALSELLLGGFNEVAVAVNAVVGTEFLLVALAPIVLAPFAEYSLPRAPAVRGFTRHKAPVAAVWAGLLVLVPAMAVLLGYGHMSLEYVLLVVGLWASVFLVGGPGRSRLLTSVAVVATSSVWFPLNGIALLLLVACWAVVIARLVRGSRDWLSLGAMVAVTAVTWDALISSTVYVLGVGLPEATAAAAGAASAIGAAGARVPSLDVSLLGAGGGTEAAGPILGVIAGAGVLATAWVLSHSWQVSRRRQVLALSPILLLITYAVSITTVDALMTGDAPNYGSQKMGYMVAVVVAAITIPVALTAVDMRRNGMTLTRWAGIAVIAMAMAADTLLPRGLSELSSTDWAAPNADKPPYWASVEVRPVAEQPISSVPIACVFLPPGAEFPSGQPDAQATYNCTRMLIGLSGLEGRVGGLMEWVTTDWLANGSFWNEWYDSISGASDDAKERRVILLGTDGSVIGFDTLGGLLDRYPPPV